MQTLQGGRVGWKWDRVSALHLNCFAVVTVVLSFLILVSCVQLSISCSA